MSELISIHPDNPQPKKIQKVVECLLDGGVIIYPTDTIYALGCDIQRTKSIERICKIKDIRPNQHLFSLICNDLSHLSEYTKPIRNDYFKLLKQTLPGPYTYVLEAGGSLPQGFRHRKTVGIRVPNGRIAQTLVSELGHPICASSIHDDDEILEYTTDPELIFERYKHLVDMVVDGGYGDNQPTTVIDLSGSEAVIIRQGKGPTIDL